VRVERCHHGPVTRKAPCRQGGLRVVLRSSHTWPLPLWLSQLLVARRGCCRVLGPDQGWPLACCFLLPRQRLQQPAPAVCCLLHRCKDPVAQEEAVASQKASYRSVAAQPATAQ
jgi:hypothetical protein